MEIAVVHVYLLGDEYISFYDGHKVVSFLLFPYSVPFFPYSFPFSLFLFPYSKCIEAGQWYIARLSSFGFTSILVYAFRSNAIPHSK